MRQSQAMVRFHLGRPLTLGPNCLGKHATMVRRRTSLNISQPGPSGTTGGLASPVWLPLHHDADAEDETQGNESGLRLT